MTTKDQNPAAEAMKNITTAFAPLFNAAKAWANEGEKFQRTAFDGMYKAIDNTHKLAKESLDIASSMTTTVQKQWVAQIDRASEVAASFLP